MQTGYGEYCYWRIHYTLKKITTTCADMCRSDEVGAVNTSQELIVASNSEFLILVRYLITKHIEQVFLSHQRFERQDDLFKWKPRIFIALASKSLAENEMNFIIDPTILFRSRFTAFHLQWKWMFFKDQPSKKCLWAIDFSLIQFKNCLINSSKTCDDEFETNNLLNKLDSCISANNNIRFDIFIIQCLLGTHLNRNGKTMRPQLD